MARIRTERMIKDREAANTDQVLNSELVLTVSPRVVSSLGPPAHREDQHLGRMQAVEDRSMAVGTLRGEERTLLALVDGHRTVGELCRLSGLSGLATARAVLSLCDRGILIPIGISPNPAPGEAPARAPSSAAANPAPPRATSASGASGTSGTSGTPGSTNRPPVFVMGTWYRSPAPAPAPASIPAPAPDRSSNDSRQPPPTSPRFRVGAYEVATRIGQGARGSVYLCRGIDTAGFERLFALKVVREQAARDEAAVQSLVREGRIGRRLRHANVQSVVEIGAYKGQPFLVLDYVEGVDLTQLAARGQRLPPPVVVTILLDLLRALQFVHESVDDDGRSLGLLHGDVSPGNVIIGGDGAARLIDFGNARLAARDDDEAAPRAATRPTYPSPEQVAGHPVDIRSDLFAAGAVMWAALTGQAALPDSLDDHQDRSPAPSDRRRPSAFGAPACLDEICLRALSRSPERRYPNAPQMAQALLRVAATYDLVASASTVADCVRHRCGQILAERRAYIQAAFGTPRAPAAPISPDAHAKAAVPDAPPFAHAESPAVMPLAPGRRAHERAFVSPMQSSKARARILRRKKLLCVLGGLVAFGATVLAVARYVATSPETPPAPVNLGATQAAVATPDQSTARP
jgi:serine/threonine-protein kinase